MTSPSDIIRDTVNAMLANVHTSLPGIVVDYDPLNNKATIQPALNKNFTSGVIPLPILENVPIVFPKNITFPVRSGDYVLLVFIERSIDLWLSVGGQVTPSDPRKFDLSDAVAIPGLMPFTDTYPDNNNQDFKISFAGSTITIKSNGDILIETSNKVAIGTSGAEVLDILERVISILETSLTTALGAPIQQTPIPPNGDTYTILKGLINSIKGVIT